MKNNYAEFVSKITGKATTDAELNIHANALTYIYNRCEPSADELDTLVAKANAASKAVTEVLRIARITEILDLGAKSVPMWAEFIDNPYFKGRTISFNKRDKAYVVKETTCRVSYDQLNDYYTETENKRLEAETGFRDPELTIAQSNKFNTLGTAFYNTMYIAAIDRNLGKAATGSASAYALKTNDNAELKCKVPSITSLEKNIRKMAEYLLPEAMLPDYKFVKADVRAICLAMVKANSEGFKFAGSGFGNTWFMNALKTRKNGGNYVVIAEKKIME